MVAPPLSGGADGAAAAWPSPRGPPPTGTAAATAATAATAAAVASAGGSGKGGVRRLCQGVWTVSAGEGAREESPPLPWWPEHHQRSAQRPAAAPVSDGWLAPPSIVSGGRREAARRLASLPAASVPSTPFRPTSSATSGCDVSLLTAAGFPVAHGATTDEADDGPLFVGDGSHSSRSSCSSRGSRSSCCSTSRSTTSAALNSQVHPSCGGSLGTSRASTDTDSLDSEPSQALSPWASSPVASVADRPVAPTPSRRPPTVAATVLPRVSSGVLPAMRTASADVGRPWSSTTQLQVPRLGVAADHGDDGADSGGEAADASDDGLFAVFRSAVAISSVPRPSGAGRMGGLGGAGAPPPTGQWGADSRPGGGRPVRIFGRAAAGLTGFHG